VSVQINGKAAFVQYVSATQINVLAPADTSTGSVSIAVTNTAGTSNSVTATMSSVLPDLSVLSNYLRAVRYPDGAVVNGTGAAETGYTTTAAVRQGDLIAFYGTGFGPTNSPSDPGIVFTGSYPTTASLADGDHAAVARVSASSSQATGTNIKVLASAKLPTQARLTERLFGRNAAFRAFMPARLRTASRMEQVAWLGGLVDTEQYARAACIATADKSS
jgi:uncharacterized protein (TIGR03437 family)